MAEAKQLTRVSSLRIAADGGEGRLVALLGGLLLLLVLRSITGS